MFLQMMYARGLGSRKKEKYEYMKSVEYITNLHKLHVIHAIELISRQD
jgi:hypothetical protein